MKCPTCKVELDRDTYEDRPVFHCQQCRGYLVNHTQVRFIKSSRKRSAESLEQDAGRQTVDDGLETVRCPKCLAAKMNKERIDLQQLGDDPFFIDVCKKCRLIWFNGGELAKLQLDYELSDKAIQELEWRIQAASRTPEEKAEFERTLANLPHAHTGVLGQLMAAIQGVVLILLAIALLVYHCVYYDFVTSWSWLGFLVNLKMLGVLVLAVLGLWRYRK